MILKSLGAAALTALSLFVANPVCWAGERLAGVVELFTSQGCKSSPPADANLAELSRRGDVLTLGYHVGYWDYMGWRDTLANPDSTSRQDSYRKTFESRSIYTPQAVVNGRMHVNGAKRGEIEGALSSLGSAGKGLVVDVDVRKRGDSIVISTGDGSFGQKAHVTIVYYDFAQSVDITAGENSGRKVRYVNPVTGVQAAGMWHGKSAVFELPASEISKRGPGGFAVLLQTVRSDGSLGPILGAANFPQGSV
ncbi:thioredoxin family protein [Mesorhizobium sp. J428]|uniref:DUF1223 domain-containing protein n=1 Tax=Mesorhizobium sp. J428 TaxID=2898440 RepID=UPI0021513B43|nr:DUF1223 domain-containing protein [Mesorhizobium sp. J428]MCR5857146.1 DUF1223 domain-containing protein [Mesorhizobium sp. J428]